MSYTSYTAEEWAALYTTKTTETALTADTLLETLDSLADFGGYAKISDLRDAFPAASRDEFDAAVNDLRRARIASIDVADGRHTRLSSEETDAAIVEEGRYHTLMRRRNQY